MSPTLHARHTRGALLGELPPLGLERDHLDALEGLFVLRRSALFDPRRTSADVARFERRAARHWEGLRLTGEAGVDEAARRAFSPAPLRSTLGLLAGLVLTPARVLRSLVTLVGHARLALPLAEALRAAPTCEAPPLDRAPGAPLAHEWLVASHAPLLDGVSAHRAIDLAALAAASLLATTRAQALLAMGRAVGRPQANERSLIEPGHVCPLLERAALEGAPRDRAVALYARGLADPGTFSAFLAKAPDHGALDLPSGPFVMGLFGDGSLVATFERRAREGRLEARAVPALGLLGPRALPLLASLARSADVELARAAWVGVGWLTGVFPELLEPSGPPAPTDAPRLVAAQLDALVARTTGAPDDLFLGQPLSVAAPSARAAGALHRAPPSEAAPRAWLRALRSPRAAPALRFELPPGWLGLTLGRPSTFGLHLARPS